MTTLVTGGSGLVGKALQKLVREDSSFMFVSSSDADLTNSVDCNNLFTRVRPDKVIHLAAKVGGLFANSNDQVNFFEVNMQINMNVVKACHAHKITRAIFCLSTCVFPSEAELPISESALHVGPPHESN
jgi:GDP-L-fucose synthase